ncbi:hypothetical protein [Brachybacterium kimchii]|uniref:Tape measure protein n=1 Tax=Brachybacterium kimchii TaxID=2942909 RepID=A0ABY4NA27_9MICO|nr:hypothetical protein [Brachybacterium kimchii]UQN30652.1 hypothetical protein M4486_04945 [Brachybacterium kimchii]
MAEQIGIKVWPDSRGFREDLKKSLARVERQLKVQIPAEVNLGRAAVADIKRRLKDIRAEIPATIDPRTIRESAERARETAEKATSRSPVEIPATLGDLDRKFVSRLKAQAQRAADAAEAAIPATVDGEHLRTELKAKLEQVERSLKATIPVEPEKAAAWRAELKHMVDDINDQKGEIEANVDLDHGMASAKLAAFTRPRSLPINLTVTKASLAKVGTALAALSGARVLKSFGSSIRGVITNLDRSLPALAAVTTAIGTLSAGALAGTSNLLGIGAGLASIAPAALALPGLFAGFGVGVGVMVAALKDAGKYLGDLGPKFGAIQDKISGNFWGKAAGPIRDLANNALPMLSARLGEVGTQLGWFFSSMASALNTPTNLGFINGILANVRDSIDIAAEGIAWFTDGLLNLANAGSAYLPQLAGWFNQISERFSAWVQTNTDNGQLFQWIDGGIAALQDLGSILANTGGILAGFATAAANAGGASLGALADGLANVNAAVNGPAFQGALTTVFQGAHDAMAALGPGVSALGDAFVSLAPTLAQIMTLAGQIGSVALTAISAAFQNPAFQGGLVTFFQGVLSGVQALAPALPALASAIGSVATFAGTLASVIGPVLGTAIQALAPVVAALMPALSSVAEVLGGVLVSAISAVAPFIQQTVTAIASWVQQNPGLAAGLAAAAVAIGGLVAGAVSLFTALAPIISAVIGIVSGLAGLGITATAVGSAIAAVAPVVGIVVAAIAAAVAIVGALVAAFVYAWNTSEQFRTAIAGLGQAIMGFLQPVIDFVTGTLVPVLQQIAGSFLAMLQQIGDALTPLMTVVAQIATQIYTLLTPLVSFLMSVLAPAFTFLGNAASVAFSLIGTVISGALAFITGILQGFLALLQGNWAGAWAAVSSTVSGALSGVLGFVSSILGAVGSWISGWVGRVVAFFVSLGARAVAAVSSGMATVRAAFSTALSAAASVVSSVLGRIVGFFSSKIAAARSAVSSGLNAVRSAFSTALSAVSSVVSSVLSRVVGFFTSKISAARSAVSSGLAAVRSAFSSVLAAVASVVSSKLASVVSFFSSKIAAARSAVSSGLNAIKSAFTSILSAIISAVSGKAAQVVNKFRDMGNRALAAVTGFVGRFTSVGRNIVQGIINGVGGAAGALYGKLKGLASGALNSAKSALGIHSPSKEFAKIGSYSVAGLIQGLQDNESKVKSTVGQLAKGITAEFSKRGKVSKANVLSGLSDQLTSLRRQQQDLRKAAKATRKVVSVVGKTKTGKVKTRTSTVSTSSAKSAQAGLSTVEKRIRAVQDQMAKIRKADVTGTAEVQAKAFWTKYAATTTASLEDLAKQRESLTARLKSANEKLADAVKLRDNYAGSLSDKLSGTFSLTSDSLKMSPETITKGFKDAAASVGALASRLRRLGKRGLDKGVIDQIAQLGAVDGAQMSASLLKASDKQLKSISSAYKKLQGNSDKAGASVANQMYGAGVQAAQGLANGLKSQLKAVNSAASVLAKSVVTTVKKNLKIHSPSRVMTSLGQYTGAGFVQGLDQMVGAAQASMTTMTRLPDVSTATGSVGPADATPGGIEDALVAALGRWQPVVNLNGREFYGVMVDSARSNRRSLVTERA